MMAPATSSAPILVYAQGALRVVHADGAFVVTDGHSEARVAGDGTVSVVGDDDDDDDDVIGVVAAAIAARMQGRFHVHAGAVAVGDDGVWLIPGNSGQGKTTTTLALVMASAPSMSPAPTLLGDDVAFVQSHPDGVWASSLWRPLHVGDTTARMFSGLTIDSEERTRAGKRRARCPQQAGAEDAARLRRVVGLVFPHIATTTSGTTPTSATTSRALSPAEVLPRLLVASAMVTWTGLPQGQAHLDALSALAQIQAVEVVLAADVLQDPTRIAAEVNVAWPRKGAP